MSAPAFMTTSTRSVEWSSTFDALMPEFNVDGARGSLLLRGVIILSLAPSLSTGGYGRFVPGFKSYSEDDDTVSPGTIP